MKRLCVIVALSIPSALAWAQTLSPGSPPDVPAGTPATPQATQATQATPQATSQAPLPPTGDLAERVSELELRVASAEAAMPGPSDERESSDRPVAVYGFLDTGLQRLFLEDSPINGVYNTRQSTFVLGKANVYVDAHPGKGWRTLIETRLTLYPHGAESFSPGYQRVDTRVYDSNDPNGRGRVPWGGVVIERAWGEWSYSQALNIQAGLFPAPYGIWNIDHGTPVLISLLLPAFQVEEAIPTRLVGVHVHGNAVLGPLDAGYHAYVSNGRTATNVDLTDDKALGGRLFLRGSGEARWTAGASGYWGSSSDETKQLDLSSGSFGVRATPSWAYKEWAGGLDFAVDWAGWRVRTEALLQRVRYEPGRQTESGLGPPGSVRPNRFAHYWYGLLARRFAHRFEPYLYVELKYSSPAELLSNFTYTPSMGFNVYFTPWAQLKTQYAAAHFHQTDRPDPLNATIRTLTSRLVFVF